MKMSSASTRRIFKTVLLMTLAVTTFIVCSSQIFHSKAKRTLVSDVALSEPREDLALRLDELERRLRVAYNYIFHLYCTGENKVLPTGGYCLTDDRVRRSWNKMWDGTMCASLEKVFGHTDVLDMGAGRGYYGRCFLRVKEAKFKDTKGSFRTMDVETEMTKGDVLDKPQVIKSWTGYDGALNIEEVTGGFIKYADLSQPLHLGRKYDWVLSLEVAEHIPSQYEQTYVENLIKHACKGIVLSWAVPGQKGHNHVNTRPMEYVQELFESRGLSMNKDEQEYLRGNSKLSYYKHVFVFMLPPERAC